MSPRPHRLQLRTSTSTISSYNVRRSIFLDLGIEPGPAVFFQWLYVIFFWKHIVPKQNWESNPGPPGYFLTWLCVYNNNIAFLYFLSRESNQCDTPFWRWESKQDPHPSDPSTPFGPGFKPVTSFLSLVGNQQTQITCIFSIWLHFFPLAAQSTIYINIFLFF